MSAISGLRKGFVMAWLKTAASGTVCAALLSGTAAFADVTPEQVWQAWEKGYETYGYDVTVGKSDRAGDVLTISDVKLVNSVEGSSFDMTIPEIRLRDRGDGSVEASVSEKMTGIARADVPNEPPVELDMVMTQTGTKLVVSGTPEDMIYDIDAPKITLEMDQASTQDKNLPIKIWLSMENTTGRYEMLKGDADSVKSSVKTGLVKYSASGADPESGGTFNFDGEFTDVTYDGDFLLPSGVPMEKLDEALNAGAKIEMAIKFASSSHSVNIDSPDGPVSQKSSGEGGNLDMTFSKEGMHFSGASKGSALEMTTKELPFPVKLAIDSADMDFMMPVSKDEAAQPFKAKLSLNGLTATDDLWNMFDPTGKLPRDPATLAIDLSGQMTLGADLFSPEVAKMPSPPIEVKTVDINRLKLSMVGADLNGTGSLEIRNGGPLPMPKGVIDLTLSGANGLMDKLVEMGLVPQDQIMFARMMLGLYAKPTGEDAYESKVEFKDGGEILVNGQRVQ